LQINQFKLSIATRLNFESIRAILRWRSALSALFFLFAYCIYTWTTLSISAAATSLTTSLFYASSFSFCLINTECFIDVMSSYPRTSYASPTVDLKVYPPLHCLQSCQLERKIEGLFDGDTWYWRLSFHHPMVHLKRLSCYFEFDFDVVEIDILKITCCAAQLFEVDA
jgi:hypothetical protein